MFQCTKHFEQQEANSATVMMCRKRERIKRRRRRRRRSCQCAVKHSACGWRSMKSYGHQIAKPVNMLRTTKYDSNVNTLCAHIHTQILCVLVTIITPTCFTDDNK
jgi:hypothetical protein